MSVATEFPPDVHIPAGARTRVLRAVDGHSVTRPAAAALGLAGPADRLRRQDVLAPAAPAVAALGAGVVDLDRWRHQFVGAQVGGRRRNVADLRIRPELIDRPASAMSASAPARLTRRGIAVLAAVSVAVAVAVVVIAWLSATASGAGSAGSASSVGADAPAIVTVHNGDSLWSIATEVAPNRDPRVVVDDLRKRNHLAGDSVTPGQQLRVR